MMASSIIPGVNFTVEYASKSPSGTVPMLDFQLWGETEPDPENPGSTRETLSYKFFEKEMTNPKVLDCASAMPHRTKVATLTQEGVRRLCNTSRELGDSQRCEILTVLMRKLQISGYSQRQRANILSGAITTFRKKERAEVLGLQPIHRLGTHDLESRRRDKFLGKTEWYRPGRRNWKKRLQEKEEEIRNINQEQEHLKVNPQVATKTDQDHSPLDPGSSTPTAPGSMPKPGQQQTRNPQQ